MFATQTSSFAQPETNDDFIYVAILRAKMIFRQIDFFSVVCIIRFDFSLYIQFALKNPRLNWVKAESLKIVFYLDFLSLEFAVFAAKRCRRILDFNEKWKIQSILKWILMGDETIRRKKE